VVTIGIFVFDGVDDLDFVGIVFGLGKASEPSTAAPAMTVMSCLRRDHAITAGGLRMDCDAYDGSLSNYDALFFGGKKAQQVRPLAAFHVFLRKAMRCGTIVYSVPVHSFLRAVGCRPDARWPFMRTKGTLKHGRPSVFRCASLFATTESGPLAVRKNTAARNRLLWAV
jgi:hypothetical protein